MGSPPKLRAVRHRGPFRGHPAGVRRRPPHRPSAREPACARWRRGRLEARRAPPVTVEPITRSGRILAIELAGRGLLPTRRANGWGLPQAEVPSTARSRNGGANSRSVVASAAAPVRAADPTVALPFRAGPRRDRLLRRGGRSTRARHFSPPSPGLPRWVSRRLAAAADLPFEPAGSRRERCRSATP